jgi:hypothetical protein
MLHRPTRIRNRQTTHSIHQHRFVRSERVGEAVLGERQHHRLIETQPPRSHRPPGEPHLVEGAGQEHLPARPTGRHATPMHQKRSRGGVTVVIEPPLPVQTSDPWPETSTGGRLDRPRLQRLHPSPHPSPHSPWYRTTVRSCPRTYKGEGTSTRGSSVRTETEETPCHQRGRPPEDVALQVVEPHPAPVPVLVTPAALVGEIVEGRLVHPHDLPW